MLLRHVENILNYRYIQRNRGIQISREKRQIQYITHTQDIMSNIGDVDDYINRHPYSGYSRPHAELLEVWKVENA